MIKVMVFVAAGLLICSFTESLRVIPTTILRGFGVAVAGLLRGLGNLLRGIGRLIGATYRRLFRSLTNRSHWPEVLAALGAALATLLVTAVVALLLAVLAWVAYTYVSGVLNI